MSKEVEVISERRTSIKDLQSIANSNPLQSEEHAPEPEVEFTVNNPLKKSPSAFAQIRQNLEEKRKSGIATADELSQLDRLIELDKDGDGDISIMELLDSSNQQFSIRDAKQHILKKYDDPKNISTKDQRTIVQLDAMDHDGDGKISLAEILALQSNFEKAEQESGRLKKAVCAIIVMLLVYMGLSIGLVYTANEMSKESRVEGGGMVTKDGLKKMVATENPRSYATLYDLPKLNAKTLNSLNELSFTTKDGMVHNYKVMGTRSSTKYPGTIYIDLGNRRELFIDSDAQTVELTTTSQTGVEKKVGVIVTSGSSTRRRLLIQDQLATNPDHDIRRRCSPANGYCLHTFDEIMALHQPHESERRLASDGIAAKEEAVTYAEVRADPSVLDLADPALGQAADFLAAMFGPEMVDGGSDTTVLKFTMKERCENYDNLVNVCKKQPAPSDFNRPKREVVQKLSPFDGLEPSGSKWVFKDEITYSKDKYSTKLEVKYGHDPFKATRSHIILQDRRDPNKMVSYDEIEIKDDTTGKLSKVITNYEDHKVELPTDTGDTAKPVAGFSAEETTNKRTELPKRRRQLREVDQLFHHHVRTKMAGFPDIHIHDAVLGERMIKREGQPHSWPEHVQRRLTESAEQSEYPEPVAALDVAISRSKADSTGLLFIGDNYTKAKERGLINNASIFTTNFSGQVHFLPVELPDATDAPDDDFGEPLSTFENVVMESTSGLIVWPARSADELSRIVDEQDMRVYKHHKHPVAKRNLLFELDEKKKYFKDSSGKNITRPKPTKRRRLVEETTAGMKMLDNHHAKVDSAFAAKMNKLNDAFGKLRAHLERMAKMPNAEEIGRKIRERRLRRLGRKLSHVNGHVPSVDAAAVYAGYTLAQQEQFPHDRADAALRSSVGAPTPASTTGTGQWAQYTPREQCGAFRTEVVRMRANIDALVDNAAPAIFNAVDLIVGIIGEGGHLETFQTALGIIMQVESALTGVVPILQHVPYAGPVIRFFARALEQLVDTVARRIKTVTDSLLLSISQHDVESRLSWIKDKVGVLMDYVGRVRAQLDEKTHMLILADSACPSAATEAICSSLNAVLTAPNNRLQPVRDFINNHAEFIHSFDEVSEDAASFVQAPEWLAATPIFNTAQAAANTVNAFLDRQFSVCIPSVCFRDAQVCESISYPCGIIWCNPGRWRPNYPCGTRMCSRQACVTLPEPYGCEECFTLSARDILDTLSGENPLITLMQEAARALGIEIPDLAFPGTPREIVVQAVRTQLAGQINEFIAKQNMLDQSAVSSTNPHTGGRNFVNQMLHTASQITQSFAGTVIGAQCAINRL